MDQVSTKLGFNESSLNAEIKQIFRQNGIKISNDAFTNLNLFFTIEGLLLNNRQIVYSARVALTANESMNLIPDKTNQILDESNDDYFHYFKDITLYDNGYVGIVGFNNYNSLKETLLNLSRQLVEDYYKVYQ